LRCRFIFVLDHSLIGDLFIVSEKATCIVPKSFQIGFRIGNNTSHGYPAYLTAADEGFKYKHATTMGADFWFTSVESIAKYMICDNLNEGVEILADDITTEDVMSMVVFAREDWYGSN
jgi:hypothetical protein